MRSITLALITVGVLVAFAASVYFWIQVFRQAKMVNTIEKLCREYDVASTISCRDALTHVVSFSPEIIILDVSLSERAKLTPSLPSIIEGEMFWDISVQDLSLEPFAITPADTVRIAIETTSGAQFLLPYTNDSLP